MPARVRATRSSESFVERQKITVSPGLPGLFAPLKTHAPGPENGIAQNAIAISLDLQRKPVGCPTFGDPGIESFDTLTPREREVMAMVVTGRLNKQIAYDIGISEITVKVHRGQVMRKMKAASLPDLARMADKLNLTADGSQVC
jgi:DNA-binding CsgD family transcriptional regulator